ncbi:hypothetical protein KR222_002229 [Zaprionus bogoriensis]|nr:hypothetical protein KR222_002229 [Zaprionus bogoriensis]
MAIAVRPQPHLNFNMLPLSATMGLAESGSAGSRAGTPTNGNAKSDIPAITVTASPGPSAMLHALKPVGETRSTTTTTTPTAAGAGPGAGMSMSGRSQCF